MRYDTVLFDLDGTLTDSADGIINTILYTLDKYGITPPREELYRFIGPPLYMCFETYLGEGNWEEPVRIYRERYGVTGLFESTVYNGIPEMLEEIKTAKMTVALSTSKPEDYSVRILEHFDLLKYFDVTAGAKRDGTLQEKADVIETALSRIPNADRSKTVIVGDRLYDMEGADLCKIGKIGVLWGFGSYDELAQYNPLLIAKEPRDVVKFLTTKENEEG